MPPAGFEPTISAGERPQTYALDLTATGTGIYTYEVQKHIIINTHILIHMYTRTYIMPIYRYINIQYRQRTYNVILRRVRVTIVAVEKQ